MRLISHCLTPILPLSGILSLIGLGNLSTPYPVSALPPVMAYASARMRLALKLFRGEPAISEFDWNFSAIHKSSPAFSTDVGAALHGVLPPLQPAHG